jgi:hypothetical protein
MARFAVATLMDGDHPDAVAEWNALLSQLRAHGWALLRDTDDGQAAAGQVEDEFGEFLASSSPDKKKRHACKGGKQGKLHLWR